MKLVNILSLSILLSAPVLAQTDCADVRFDLERLDGAMGRIDVREQSFGNCYAYTATTAYDALMQSMFNADSEKISDAFSTSLEYTAQEKEKDASVRVNATLDGTKTSFESGADSGAMRYLLKHGSCIVDKESEILDSGLFDGKQRRVQYFQELMNLLIIQEEISIERYKKEMAYIPPALTTPRRDAIYVDKGIYNRNDEPSVEQDQQDYQKYLDEQFESVLSDFEVQIRHLNQTWKMNKDIDDKVTNSILRVLRSKMHKRVKYFFSDTKGHLLSDLKSIFTDNCERMKLSPNDSKRVFVYSTFKDPEVQYTDSWFREKMRKMLSSSTNQQPIVISMCSKIYSDPHYIGIKKDGKTFRTHKDCGNHSVLVIGSRKNPSNGRCELLIRNSWGNLKGFGPFEKTPSGMSEWISENTIINNTIQMSRYYLRY